MLRLSCFIMNFQIFDMLLNGDLYPYKPYFYNVTLTNNYYNFLLTEVIYLSHIMRKPAFCICEKQRCGSAAQ